MPTPTPTAKGKEKPHTYTTAEETFIAKVLAEEDTWRLLNGPGEKNDHYYPKIQVYADIAERFNRRFSMESSAIVITGGQLKNKVAQMTTTWKVAQRTYNSTGNGDLPESTLHERVLRQCHFFFILNARWSDTITYNAPDPIQLTANLSRGGSSLVEVSDDNSDDDGSLEGREDTIEEQQDSGSPGRHSLPTETPKGKKRGNSGQADMLQSLSEQSQEGLDLKRVKLEMEKTTHMEKQTLIRLQARKLQAELDASDARKEFEVKHEEKRQELEMMKMALEKTRILVEQRKLNRELNHGSSQTHVSWIELDLENTEKATLRVKSTSPPCSPAKDPLPQL